MYIKRRIEMDIIDIVISDEEGEGGFESDDYSE